jgi:hypothetical protein
VLQACNFSVQHNVLVLAERALPARMSASPLAEKLKRQIVNDAEEKRAPPGVPCLAGARQVT